MSRNKSWSFKPPPGTQINWGHPLAKDLYCLFLFNEAGGSTAFNSTRAGTPKATLSGPNLWQPGSNRFGGRSPTFNGTSNYASSATAIQLTNTNTITLDFWMYWDAFADNDKLALETSTNYNLNPGGILIDPNSGFPSAGRFAVGFTSVGGYRVESFTRPSALVWHHYVFVLTVLGGGLITNYVDMIQQTNTVDLASLGVATGFGNHIWYFMSRATTSLFGAGRLAKFAIYRRGLSKGEVATLYREPFAYLNSPKRTRASLNISTPVTVGNAPMTLWGSHWGGVTE